MLAAPGVAAADESTTPLHTGSVATFRYTRPVAKDYLLSLAHRDADPRIGLGVAAAGAASGLVVGTLLTARMGREVPAANGTLRTLSWQPIVTPVAGGAIVGVGGFM